MPGPRPKYALTRTPAPEARGQHLSTGDMAPFATVQRARIVLLAQRDPQGQNATSARQGGCPVPTVQHGRPRGQTPEALPDAPRAGRRRTCPPRPRAQVVALACRAPRQYGQPWPRWAGETLAQGAVEQGIVGASAPRTIRRGLRADKIKPWRSPSWQPSTDPQFVAKAPPGRDRYAHAPARQAHGALIGWAEEKTALQARPRVSSTTAAAPGAGGPVAERSKRLGARQLFCALGVASGLPSTPTRMTKKFVDFTAFLLAFFHSALWAGRKVRHLLLATGPPHAPKQLGAWLASRELAFEVRVSWLPKHASWLEQVELLFSKVQRALLTPTDFPSRGALERDLAAYFADLNTHPKPSKWTYTTTKLLAKFETPPLPLAA